MLFTELIPLLKELSRTDKLLLIHFLAAELLKESSLVPLGGNLARFEARALVLMANVEQFPTVELAFAWTRDRNAPLILGHMNFFLAFDVCFYRSELVFEISPKIA